MKKDETSGDTPAVENPPISAAEQKRLDAEKAKKAEDDAEQRKERLRLGVS